MVMCSPSFLINTLLTGLLFIASSAYAESGFLLTQNHTLIINDNFINESQYTANVELQDILLKQGAGKFLRYNFDADIIAGIKVHSSLDLKFRSSATLLQYKMRF